MNRCFALAIIAASTISAPLLPLNNQPAQQAQATAVYCVEVGPAGVGTTQIYPGGKYCVPGP